ncbi:LANO_0F07976g1_1 [Lachancea nothofagi CBS 11611]|uniref:LANO_0F07976g1_1 n=1 Tax=Lachancea nothofagi CBS 11611 TaxID=1266666 RepID=A0A1G4K967_9SACH|nr:LANO_0F07976g1_1 [Lachancea nothofagi CBS 11611]
MCTHIWLWHFWGNWIHLKFGDFLERFESTSKPPRTPITVSPKISIRMPLTRKLSGMYEPSSRDETTHSVFNAQTLYNSCSMPSIQTGESFINGDEASLDNNTNGWQFRSSFDPDLSEDYCGSTTTDLDYNINTPSSLSPSLNSSFVSGTELQPLRPVLDMANLTLQHSHPMLDMGNELELTNKSSPGDSTPPHLGTHQVTKPVQDAEWTASKNQHTTATTTPRTRSNGAMTMAKTTRSCRNFWSSNSDRALLETMLRHQNLLRSARKCRPRSRYWLCISESLTSDYNMHRNKRQCRDRFNLIYWKAVRDRQQERDLEHTSQTNRLMDECMLRFYIDKDNNLMLRVPGDTTTHEGSETVPDKSSKPKPKTEDTSEPMPLALGRADSEWAESQESMQEWKNWAIAAGKVAGKPPGNPIEAFLQLQKQTVQLTQRIEMLQRALDSQRVLVQQYEQTQNGSLHLPLQLHIRDPDRHTGGQVPAPTHAQHNNNRW